MPVPGFGYSVGDFIATIELIAKVIAAFQDGTGASSEYQQVLQELETLLHLLQHISTIQSTERNFACVNAIKGVALNLQAPLRKFLDNICKRYGALGGQKKGSRGVGAGLGVIGRKAQWAVVMEKDIGKLRVVIGTNMSSILLLLNMNHLDATSFIESLAKVNQNDLLLKNAEILQELLSQRSTTSRLHVQQMDGINGVKSNIADLTSISGANADRLGVIERRQNRDSIALMQFLEFMRRIVFSLGAILPSIYEVICKMILSNLHLYALLLSIQTTVSQMPTMLLSDNIHFEDVLGRVRSLPYQSFRYWKVFQAFLKCEFENLPGELNIRRGLYHIVDAKFATRVTGEIAWKQGVFPGRKLHMSVIIESFRRRGSSCPRQQCPGISELSRDSSPFLLCPNCGLRFTDISETAQPRIVELEESSEEESVSFQSPPSALHGPVKTAPSPIKAGAKGDDKVPSWKRLGQAKQNMRKRERLEILKFNRIHIRTSKDMNAEFGILEVLELPNNPVTLLQKAAAMGNVVLVQLLIEDGVSIDERGGAGLTAMHHAAWEGSVSVVQLLLHNGANIDEATNDGPTPLHVASISGHEHVVQLLIQNQANITATTCNGCTPLHIAAARGHRQVMQLLIQNGANINAITNIRWTSLHYAARDGHEQVVQLLIQNQANITATTSNGCTPLHTAAARGYKHVVKLLIQSGANVNAMTNNRWTSLHYAARDGHEQVVQLLILNEANIDAKNKNGSTPLHLATRNGHDQVGLLLIQSGANVNAMRTNGLTPLHYAAVNGHWQVVELLILHGANIDSEDNNGSTPLDNAAFEGHKEVVRLLLDHR